MRELKLACECGEVSGRFLRVSPRTTIRLLCYCDDCQAFAATLGRSQDLLDAFGATEAVQCTLPQLRIESGHDRLRSLTLKPGGLLRWHTDCCRLPIANTISARIPFLAILRSFIRDDHAEEALGPIQFRIFCRFAKNLPGDIEGHPGAPLGMLMKAGPRILAAKLRGKAAGTGFFDERGEPSVEPYLVQ